MSIYLLYFLCKQIQDSILYFNLSDWYTDKVREIGGDYRINRPVDSWPEDLQKKYPDLYEDFQKKSAEARKQNPPTEGPDGNDSRYASDIDEENKRKALSEKPGIFDKDGNIHNPPNPVQDAIFADDFQGDSSDYTSDSDGDYSPTDMQYRRYTIPSDSSSEDESQRTIPTDSENSSDDEKTPPHLKYSPAIIFDQFKQMIHPCRTPKDVVRASMTFMETMFPQELLAKVETDIYNPLAEINKFQDRALAELNLLTDEDRIQFLTFRTAISTYNAGVILHATDHAFLEKIFEETLNMQVRNSLA